LKLDILLKADPDNPLVPMLCVGTPLRDAQRRISHPTPRAC